MLMKANDYEVKEIIRFIREWTELSKKEFGNAVNRSPKTIKNWERGERIPNLEMFLEIAKTHNIEIILTKKSK